jgi:hypothetical protein
MYPELTISFSFSYIGISFLPKVKTIIGAISSLSPFLTNIDPSPSIKSAR